jgi:hypothetical protein
MDAPRKPNAILSELRELDTIIVEGDVFVQQFPEDNFLKISQAQASTRKSILQKELFESQKYYGQQSFVLAFDKKLSGLDAHLIPSLIKALTDVLDQTQRLISDEKRNFVPLLFNGVVNSSFGLHFSIDKGQNLFGNEYDDLLGIVFETIDELNQAQSLDDIRAIIHKRFEGHKPILKSYRSFFQSVNKAELPLKVFWRSPTSKDLAFKMESETSEKLFLEFKKTLNTTENIREYRGEIQGLSQWEKKVEFLAVDGNEEKRIVAHFDENNSELFNQIKVFNKPRLVTFKVRESVNEFTDENKIEYELISVQKI